MSPEREMLVGMIYVLVIFSILVQGLMIDPLVRRVIKKSMFLLSLRTQGRLEVWTGCKKCLSDVMENTRLKKFELHVS